MSSIPGRVNALERGMDVVVHRLEELEGEKLPHRVTNLESATSRMTEDMHDVKSTVAEMSERQTIAFQELGTGIASIRSFARGAAYIISTLLVVVGLVIAAANLLPKFDAIIIDKNPPAESRK